MNCPVKGCAKKIFVPAIAVLVFIFAYDFVIHGILLKSTYEATAPIWRPMEEMNQFMPWVFLHNLLLALAATALFCKCVGKSGKEGACEATPTTPAPGQEACPTKPCCPYARGICFGSALGLVIGVTQAGIYPYLPIPLSLALSWFAASLVQGIGIGVILSLLCKKMGDKE